MYMFMRHGRSFWYMLTYIRMCTYVQIYTYICMHIWTHTYISFARQAP